MLVSGSGTSGLAIVILKQSEADEYRHEIWAAQPIFKKALTTQDRETVLRIALRRHSSQEKLTATEMWSLEPELLDILTRHKIRVVLTVGRIPFNLLTHRQGSEERFTGAIIPRDELQIVPIPAPWSVHVLEQPFLTQVIRRAWALAQGSTHNINWSHFITEPDLKALEALEGIKARGLPVAVDIETAGVDVLEVPITAMGLADSHVAVSMPWEAYHAGRYGDVAPLYWYEAGPAIERLMTEILESGQTKVLHNGQYDSLGLRKRGIHLGGKVEDTLLAHRLIYPNRAHNLQTAALSEFGVEPWKSDFRQAVGDFIENNHRILRLYNAKDTAATIAIWSFLETRLKTVHNGTLLYEQYKELSVVAAQMQEVGIRVDEAQRDIVIESVTKRMDELRDDWTQLAPDVNLGKAGSSARIKELFFEDLQAPVLERSKKTEAPALPAMVLMEYMTDPKLLPYARTLFRYKKNAKLLTAFLEPMRTKDRLHPTFKVWGTKGARWSSSGPNIQQVSKEKEVCYVDGLKELVVPSIRPLLIADKDFVLLEADYSQLELRVVAHFSAMSEVIHWLEMDRKEPNLWDPHVLNARQMFKRPELTKKDPLRQVTKTLTYALFYNYYQGVDMVYKSLKPSMPTLTLKQLEEIQKRFYAVRPELPKWQDSIAHQIKTQGYVEAPIYGRRQYQDRRKPDLNQALSFPIQSTAGDLANRAVLEVAKQLDWSSGEHVKAQVHDALIVQCRPESLQEVARLVKTAMERPVTLLGKEVIFPVDIKYGHSWGTMEELKL